MAKTDLIGSYIRSEPASVQKVLKQLRTLIAKAAPQATEKLAWGMPTFHQQGNLIHFAAFKGHVSLFPGSDAVEHFQPELKRRGLVHSKGTIQIPYETKLPTQLLTRIVKYCVKRNLTEGGAKKAKAVRRARRPVPAFIRSALLQTGLMEAYHARPPYQRNDYVSWVASAVREETKQKRLAQMIRELKLGNRYMNMPYRTKR